MFVCSAGLEQQGAVQLHQSTQAELSEADNIPA